MKVKNGLSPILSNLASIKNRDILNGEYICAQVIDVVLDNSSDFGIGTIYWKKYIPSKNEESEENINLDSLNKAIPFWPGLKLYPVKGELVIILVIPEARVDIM